MFVSNKKLYHTRINNLPKGLKDWFDEIDDHISEDFVNIINGVFEECENEDQVEHRFYNLRNEFWHYKEYWNDHIDEYLSRANYYIKDDVELGDEISAIYKERHFKNRYFEDQFYSNAPLVIEMIIILKAEPNLTEDQFVKKIDNITEEKTIIGHGDGWDENGRHFITPMVYKVRVLKRMNKKPQ